MPAYQWDRQAIGQRAITQPWSQEWISAVNSTPIETIFKNLKGYRDEATEKQRFDEWKTKHPDDKTSWEQWVRAMAKGYYPGRLTQNVSVPEFTGPVYGTGQTRTPYDYFVNGQGGYGTPPLGSTPARQTGWQMTEPSALAPPSTEPRVKWADLTPEQQAWVKKTHYYEGWNPNDPNYTIPASHLNGLTGNTTPKTTDGFVSWEEFQKSLEPGYTGPPKTYIEGPGFWDPGGLAGHKGPNTTPQTPIPTNWMDTVNKAVGQKYQGANAILSSPSVGSPAGNNLASGSVNPTAALSGNNLATTATAPGAGTSTFGTNTSFLNPASGTATQKRKTGANKYFNQQWFGGKQML